MSFYKQEPKLKGLVLDLRNDPVDTQRSRGDFVCIPAENDRGQHQQPDRREQTNLQGIGA